MRHIMLRDVTPCEACAGMLGRDGAVALVRVSQDAMIACWYGRRADVASC